MNNGQVTFAKPVYKVEQLLLMKQVKVLVKSQWKMAIQIFNDENKIVDALNNSPGVLNWNVVSGAIVIKTSKLSFTNCHYILEVLLKNLYITMD